MKRIRSFYLLIFFSFLQYIPGEEISNGLLTAEQSVDIALRNSPFSRRIEQQYRLTRSGRYDLISPVLPQLSFSSGFSRFGAETDILIDPVPDLPASAQVFTVDEYRTLFSLFGNLFDLSSFVLLGQLNTVDEIADNSLRDSRAELALNVKESFLTLVTLHNEVHVAQASLAQSEEQLEIARELLRLGVIARAELLRLETNFIEQRVNLIQASRVLENSLRGFADLIGVDPPVQIDTVLPFPDTEGPLPSLDSLRVLVLERNPGHRVSILTEENQRAAERAVRFRRVPTLSGSFSYGYTAPEMFTSLSQWRENDFWSIGFDVNVMLFEGLSWRGQRIEAAAQSQIAQTEVEISVNEVIQQLDAAYADLHASREALTLVPDLLEAAQEEFRLIREQFRLGAASALDLLQAQLTLNQAQLQSVSIITNHYRTEAVILRLVGEW
ncbi:outer membrane efflux protein [Chitinispirillum alkaliphilum]|nr:outer membrane efflux protein [Chitinispirillum alkaliphilum]